MPQLGVLFLANVFSALLPPIDPDEQDFYEILGLSKDSTMEDIRKAYKVQSLKLHPDKVAQRGNMNPEQAAQQYQLVQEAYGVLVNDEKRQRYHALGYSPTRYRFVAQGALANPGALYENLTGASCLDKTRLVLLCTILVLLVLMQPILVAAKINQMLEQQGQLAFTPWTVIFIPFWIFGALYICLWCILVLLAPSGSARCGALLTVLEYCFWYVAVIVLSLKWDHPTDTTPYSKVMIPIYLAMSMRWFQRMAFLGQIRRDLNRMVTVEYLEKHVLQGKSLDDLTPEEEATLRQNYLVVTIPTEFEPVHVGPDGDYLNEEEFEAQRVEASQEYDAATIMYSSTLGGLMGSMIFLSIFLILVVRKLDHHIDASYWAVFTPIWIYIGSRWVYNFYRCLCSTVVGDEVILQMHVQGDEDKDKEETKEHDTEDACRPKDDNFLDAGASTTFNKADDKSNVDKTLDDTHSTSGAKSTSSRKNVSTKDEASVKSAASRSSIKKSKKKPELQEDEARTNISKKKKKGQIQSTDSGEGGTYPTATSKGDNAVATPVGKSFSGDQSKASARTEASDAPLELTFSGFVSGNEPSQLTKTEVPEDEARADNKKETILEEDEDKEARNNDDAPTDEEADKIEDKEKSKTEKDAKTKTAGTDKKENGNDIDNDKKNDDDDKDSPNIHIDEETFRAWQSAYEEAERGAMEEQARASGECCNLTIQLILVCLVVAKIEQNYDGKYIDGEPGFNTFWILFPFFVFFGVVICCCACLIYGASPASAADLQDSDLAQRQQGESVGGGDDAENPAAKTSPDVIVMLPPAADHISAGGTADESPTGLSASAGGSGGLDNKPTGFTDPGASSAEFTHPENPKQLGEHTSTMEDLD